MFSLLLLLLVLLSAADGAGAGGRLRELFLDLLLDPWLESHVRVSAAAAPSAKGVIHDGEESDEAATMMVVCQVKSIMLLFFVLLPG